MPIGVWEPKPKHSFGLSVVKGAKMTPKALTARVTGMALTRQLGDVATMADNSLQKNSSAFRLPALDTDFLLGDSMRGVRLQLEYEKAEQRLRAWTVRSTVVVFGSARVLPGKRRPERLYRDIAGRGRATSRPSVGTVV